MSSSPRFMAAPSSGRCATMSLRGAAFRFPMGASVIALPSRSASTVPIRNAHAFPRPTVRCESFLMAELQTESKIACSAVVLVRSRVTAWLTGWSGEIGRPTETLFDLLKVRGRDWQGHVCAAKCACFIVIVAIVTRKEKRRAPRRRAALIDSGLAVPLARCVCLGTTADTAEVCLAEEFVQSRTVETRSGGIR
jgi:hypothetical protein